VHEPSLIFSRSFGSITIFSLAFVHDEHKQQIVMLATFYEALICWCVLWAISAVAFISFIILMSGVGATRKVGIRMSSG